DLVPTQRIAQLVAMVLALAYLVPPSARTGQTWGKRRAAVKLVRVDGSPVGFGGSPLPHLRPFALGVFATRVGPIAAVGMVGFAFFSRTGQGLHDRLARTLVVAA